MKRLLGILVVCMALWGLAGSSWVEARRSSEEQREKEERSMFRDRDHDGIPNRVDPYDNEGWKDPEWRDDDGDGTPNAVDPYDNEGHKP